MKSIIQNILRMPPIVFAALYFIVIFGLNWLGYLTRKRISRLHPDKDIALGAAEGSLFGLMTFLLAFSFGIAATRFENRRQVIIEEANFINTAIMRCELYPDSIKQWLLPDFKQYLESRIAYYDAGDRPGEDKVRTTLNDANQHFKSIWSKTNQLAKDREYRSLAEEMVPVLINMKNTVAIREAGRHAKFPLLISIVLLLLVFVSSFIMGFGVKPGQRIYVVSLAFALMTTATLFLVMELARPRTGFINLKNAEQTLVDLRKSFQ